MKKINILILTICLSILFSCKKKDDNQTVDTKVDFSITCADTLFFDNVSQDEGLSVNVVRNGGATSGDVALNLSNFSNSEFYASANDIICPIDESRSLNVHFTSSNLAAGIHTCKLTATQANYSGSSNTKTKTIYLKVQPTCAFSFKDFINGNITYNINGIKNNYSVDCKYELDNTLSITGLTPYKLTLKLNCNDNTFTVKQLTYNGWLIGGSGTYTNSKISGILTNNGVNNASFEIIP